MKANKDEDIWGEKQSKRKKENKKSGKWKGQYLPVNVRRKTGPDPQLHGGGLNLWQRAETFSFQQGLSATAYGQNFSLGWFEAKGRWWRLFLFEDRKKTRLSVT